MKIGIAVGGLACALLCFLLDNLGFRSKKLFATLCLLLMMISAVSPLSELFSSVLGLLPDGEIGEAAECALRAVGLGYVFGFTSEVCTSLGEGTIASTVTTLGKIEIFALAIPYFEKTFRLALSLFQ
jgi:hypothetical protein